MKKYIIRIIEQMTIHCTYCAFPSFRFSGRNIESIFVGNQCPSPSYKKTVCNERMQSQFIMKIILSSKFQSQPLVLLIPHWSRQKYQRVTEMIIISSVACVLDVRLAIVQWELCAVEYASVIIARTH